MSTMRWTRSLAVAGLLVSVFGTALASPANAAAAPAAATRAASTTDDLGTIDTGPPPGVQVGPPTRRAGSRSFANLREAVAGGVVDQEVADRVSAGTAAQAILVIADDDIIASASSSAGRDTGRRIRDEQTGFQSRKRAIHSGRRARVIADQTTMPTQLVEFTSPAELLSYANSADVEGIRENAVIEATAAQSDTDSLALIRQPQTASTGHRGAGTYVAVLDTGIDHTQPAFGSCTAVNTPSTCRVAYSGEFDGQVDGVGYGTNVDYTDDGSLHGTNVSGVVANVAPSAKLLSYDVFYWYTDPTDGKLKHGTDANRVAAAINDIRAKKAADWNIVAINLSIGGAYTYRTSNCTTDAYEASLGAAWQAGIIPVVAAGNDRVNKAGALQLGISSPACSTYALSVGAVYDATGNVSPTCAGEVKDTVTCFSQTSPVLEMVAPGSYVEAAGVGMQGTSQAAPHVAGALAVLKSAKPAATPSALWTAVTTSGPLVSDPLLRESRNRLDLPGALAKLGIGVDTTPPTVTAPTHIPQLFGTANSTIPFQFNWSASDASGVAAYDVYVSTNGGAYTAVALGTTAKSAVLNLTPGARYQLAVAAKDGRGNWSGYTYGSQFLVSSLAETNSAIVYSSGWTQSLWSSALGGALRVSAKSGATATVTFTGRSIAWVATKAPTRGRATVYIDGVLQGTWDLYSATTKARHLVLNKSFPSGGTHTLKIVNQATSGRPDIDVDGFVITS